MSSIRYMGTKRHLLPAVHDCSKGLYEGGDFRFVDLFAGTGAVAGSFATIMPVTCNDALAFPGCLGRARFLRVRGGRGSLDWTAFRADIQRRFHMKRRSAASRIAAESDALRRGALATQDLIAEALHPGNDTATFKLAQSAKSSQSHVLATLYFSRGYFATEQAVALDVIRAAVDDWFPSDESKRTAWSHVSVRELLLASWLVTASRVINSPGHTAQFLGSRSEGGFRRVRANWRRDVIAEFIHIFERTPRIGDSDWRRRNRITQLDASALADSPTLPWDANTILYADPPYTKDHYSRYYHVLETLYRYDYPESSGKARIRRDRHLSEFCYKSRAAGGFSSLGRLAQRVGAPLLISYPQNGLIPEWELCNSMAPFGDFTRAATITHRHSSLGGSPGRNGHSVEERLYLLRPW